MVISDARLGAFQSKIKSVIISHHLHFPIGVWLFEKVSAIWIDFFISVLMNYGFQISPVNKIFQEAWRINTNGQKHFIGAISRFNKLNLPNKYDIAVVLSGPEPQRSYLEEILLNQLNAFTDKRIIIVRGVSSPMTSPSKFETINLAGSEQLNTIISSSDLIICRSGYTSLLDLHKLHKSVAYSYTWTA